MCILSESTLSLKIPFSEKPQLKYCFYSFSSLYIIYHNTFRKIKLFPSKHIISTLILVIFRYAGTQHVQHRRNEQPLISFQKPKCREI